MPRIVEIDIDPHHEGLKTFLEQSVAAARANKDADKFLTYKPLHGKAGRAYILLRKEGKGSPLAAAHGKEKAEALAKAAKGGVKSRGSVEYEEVAAHGKHDKPAPYLVAVAVEPGSNSGGSELSKHLKDANAASPVTYRALRAKKSGPSLVLLPIKSLSDVEEKGHLNKPRLTSHLGEEKAEKVATALKGRKPAMSILRYVPEYSNP